MKHGEDHMRSIVVWTAASLLTAVTVSAAEPTPVTQLMPPARKDIWKVCWMSPCDQTVSSGIVHSELSADRPVVADQNASHPPRPVAIQYSDGYQLRRKIHRYASFATLPLFAIEFALGQSMFNTTPADDSAKRGLHAAIGVGIIGLFGVNTVTGAWNLFGEGRKDPNHRTLRLVHGLLMMAADAGFVATATSGPNSRNPRHALTYETDKVTHRNLGIASISVGTAGYLLMLFGNR
jgi:hypothetical protein